MVITNEAQPPQTITTTSGVILQNLPRDGREKWLGSMLTSRGSKLHHVGPNGGHNLMVLATIFKTEGFRYWICALLMMSLFLQNLMRKSVFFPGHVLDVLVDALRKVGLVLNAGRTKILTTQSQHPAELVSPGGIVVEILERDRAHKWLACMISTHRDGSHGLDLEHHLQAASSAFYANKSCSSDKSVSIAQRLVYFDAIYTSCLFCKWPSQNLQTGPSQVGRRIPQTRAHHCGPSWRLRLAPHPSRVERTRFRMC